MDDNESWGRLRACGRQAAWGGGHGGGHIAYKYPRTTGRGGGSLRGGN